MSQEVWASAFVEVAFGRYNSPCSLGLGAWRKWQESQAPSSNSFNASLKLLDQDLKILENNAGHESDEGHEVKADEGHEEKAEPKECPAILSLRGPRRC